jgi:hypothetical protein
MNGQLRRPGRGAALFCLVAGGGDAATGLLLLSMPVFVLSLLGIAEPGADAVVFLRFAGVFVGCVGLTYLYPWRWRGVHRERRLLVAVEVTAGFRLAVALFLGIAVSLRMMAAGWLLVAGYDGAVALVQLGLRSRGTFGHG